jgi:hypothetical protein
MVDNDCLQLILNFSDSETIANMMQVSKMFNEISTASNDFNKFHNEYTKAFNTFHDTKKNITHKKRLIYKVLDILVQNQKHWRIVQSAKSYSLSKKIHTFVSMFVYLSCIPKRKKENYSRLFTTYYKDNAHKYSFVSI